jgi:hypothetical protein
MTIAFISASIHSRRRLRLGFSESLAAGAYTTLTYYTVTCEDAGGVDPDVVAAFVVPSSPAVVELALGDELVDGSAYTVSAIGVPASGGSTTPAGSVLPMRPGVVRARPVAISPEDDILAITYGADLVWDGSDFVEDAQGDLSEVSGRENVHAALKRRLTSDGLPWDSTYGTKPREYVDGSSLAAQQLRGALASQAVQDDRVKRAIATVLPENEDHPEETTIETVITLIDGTVLDVQSGVKTS